MEVGATSFLFFRLSPSLVVSPFGLHLCIYLCTTDNSGARVESQQGNPLTGQSGPREKKRATSWETERRWQPSLKTRRKREKGSRRKERSCSMEAAVREVGMIRGKETRLIQGLTTLSLLLAQPHARPHPKQKDT